MIEVRKQKVSDMKKKHVVGNYEKTTVTYLDGNTRTIFYTQEETLVQNGERMTSCADLDGTITLVNAAFIRVSGYTKEELIGAPHSILKHPDMPKIVFEIMWLELKTNGQWHGYIKNLRKDGGFYWVHASVFSNYRNGELVGYTSTREAAPRDKVMQSMQQYAKLRD